MVAWLALRACMSCNVWLWCLVASRSAAGLCLNTHIILTLLTALCSPRAAAAAAAVVQASDSKFWVVVGLFAAATPLGIAIGYASSVLGHGPVSAAMSALASGTFLYVALNEVIPKELEHPDGHRLAKVAALLLGFGLMSLLAVWA
jgi:zinc transporter 1/2/3